MNAHRGDAYDLEMLMREGQYVCVVPGDLRVMPVRRRL